MFLYSFWCFSVLLICVCRSKE